jgi:hypothetical protein
MATLNQYLLQLLMQGDNATEQEAIESAIFDRFLPLTYHFEKDRLAIEQQKPQIITHFLQTRGRPAPPSPILKAAKKSTRPGSRGAALLANKKSARPRASLRTHPKPKKG